MAFTATAWNNGKFHSTGAGYGLRIPLDARDEHFQPSWSDVVVELQGKRIIVPLSPSFWRSCHELRSADIGRWLIRQGHAKWPKQRPPAFEMAHIAANRFVVR